MTRWPDTIAARGARLRHANGFDALRLALALGIVSYHSFTIANGGPAGMPPMLQAAARLILPAFFALSGFLVAASLERCADVREFLLLRALRILPALSITVAVTALVLGPLLTALPPREYLADPALPGYFRNLLGHTRYALPGLFEANPRAGVVNGSLWTIQLELMCYGLLALAALLLRGRALILGLAAAGLLLLFPTTPFLGLLLAWLPAKNLALAFCAGALLQRLGRHAPMHWTGGTACLAVAFLAPPGATVMVLPLAYGAVWLGMRKVPAWLTRADYSYGIYLTAYPLQQASLLLMGGHARWWMVLGAGLPLAWLCAVILWHGIERPILSRKHEIAARLRGVPVRA